MGSITKNKLTKEQILMEELEGTSFFTAKETMSEEECASINKQAGALLFQVNQIKGESFGHFCIKERQCETWFDAFYAMVSGVIADGISVGIEIGVSYDTVLKKLRVHKECFSEVTEPVLIHFDSWDGNIFVKDGKITGLIDWERALWAEGLMEDRFRFHSVNKDFLKGYGIGELTENQKIRCMWYDVYLYMIMMFEGAFRHYETDDQYKWVQGLFMQIWSRL